MPSFTHQVNSGKPGDGFGVGDVDIKFDPRKMSDLLRGDDGPVAKFIIKLTRQAADRAIADAPVAEQDPFGRNRPGNLRDHIVTRFDTQHDGLHGFITVGVPYAAYVHEGTEPHVMPPKSPGFYVFALPAGSQNIVYTHGPIDHPGNLPNRFLVRAIHDTMTQQLGASNVHGDDGH